MRSDCRRVGEILQVNMKTNDRRTPWLPEPNGLDVVDPYMRFETLAVLHHSSKLEDIQVCDRLHRPLDMAYRNKSTLHQRTTTGAKLTH
ncbi:hypothetical protein B5P20_07700 [Clavibacter sepedonicus]|nr:hypothetical protein B5P20_07700 [Clavibacter sepedonicus]